MVSSRHIAKVLPREANSWFVCRCLPIQSRQLGSHKVRAVSKSDYRQGLRLIVVDDNQDAANSLAMLLRFQGHDVRVAFSGMAALEITNHYQPHAILLDIGMPGMDGYEAARRLREQDGLREVTLIALTGWGHSEDRRRTAEAGFNHHLVKPPEISAVEASFRV